MSRLEKRALFDPEFDLKLELDTFTMLSRVPWRQAPLRAHARFTSESAILAVDVFDPPHNSNFRRAVHKTWTNE